MSSEDIAAYFIEKLEQADIPYMVVGAYSSNFYGVARSTNDVDFVVAFQEFGLVEFCRSLGSDYVLDRQMLLEGFTGTTRNVVHHKPSGFAIELFRLSEDPHHQERFTRKRREALGRLGREAWIPTGEDVVIQKLRWGRRKDLDDIVNVLIVSGRLLDWEYIRRWTDTHGTTQLLEQLRAEVED